MDEDFIDVTESGNKLIGFVLITITLAILVLGYFFVYQKINFSVKNIKVEVGSTLSEDVNDYLNKSVVDTSGYDLNLKNVKVDEVGEYTYTITYNKKSKKGKVSVVDTTPPVFETQSLTIEVGDEFYLGDTLTKCEDVSKPCIVTFKNIKDADKLDNPGDYTFKVLVSDIYKNSIETTINIKVVEKGTLVDEKAIDLVFDHSSSELENFKDQYYEKLDKAIHPEDEVMVNLTARISSFDIEGYVSKNYEGYSVKASEIVLMYNKSNYVMGFVIKVEISKDGSNKTIFVTKEENE